MSDTNIINVNSVVPVFDTAKTADEPIKPIEHVDAVSAPIESVEPIDRSVTGATETAEPPKAAPEAKPEATPTIHIITFRGNGVWIDNKREMWCRQPKSNGIETERRYTHDEYIKRGDLQFMVQYGEMKEQII